MSIRKRTWDVADGKGEAWIATIATRERDARGKLKRTTRAFGTKAEARAWVAESTIAVSTGTFTPPSKSPTVQEAGELWLERVESNKRERTTRNAYEQHLRYHINPRIGHLKLAELSTPYVESFAATLTKELSNPMARKVLGSLKMLLKDSVRRGLIAYNAASPTRIDSDRRSKRKLKAGEDFPTQREIRLIIAAAPEGKSRALLMVAAFAGLRSSEIRGLRWKDVAFNSGSGTITVEQRADRFGVIGSPKSESGHRTIPVGPILVNTLRPLKIKTANDSLVFATSTGRPQTHGNVLVRVFHRAQIAAGVVNETGEPKYTGLHCLRHFAASHMLHPREHGGLGLSLKQAQERLGHATLAMTADTYGHLLPVDDDGAALAAAERHLFAVS